MELFTLFVLAAIAGVILSLPVVAAEVGVEFFNELPWILKLIILSAIAVLLILAGLQIL